MVDILVVEDDPSWEKILRKTLEKAGYHVETVTTLRDAIDNLEMNSYQVVVTDIRLTEEVDNRDGIRLLEWIKKRELNTKNFAISGRPVSGLDKKRFKDEYKAVYIERLGFNNVEFIELIKKAIEGQ